ncbi:hypothetical protein [Streptomyces sp. NPDC059009]|uniref:hypothetical protein n=1 Tax=Streptomyces sp. NPDC059009 TaxID=3346694 RepID=UPI0036A7494C
MSDEQAQAVEDVVKELRTALTRAGITLPSLGIDPVSLAREAPRPLVELGRCDLGAAERLTKALGAHP